MKVTYVYQDNCAACDAVKDIIRDYFANLNIPVTKLNSGGVQQNVDGFIVDGTPALVVSSNGLVETSLSRIGQNRITDLLNDPNFTTNLQALIDNPNPDPRPNGAPQGIGLLLLLGLGYLFFKD